MPTFVYEARDKEGQLHRDTIEGDNVRAATKTLMAQGMTVINIRERKIGQQNTSVDVGTLIRLLIAVVALIGFFHWFGKH